MRLLFSREDGETLLDENGKTILGAWKLLPMRGPQRCTPNIELNMYSYKVGQDDVLNKPL